ncbi:MAG: tRNA uridine-5-carboxymethylaminomethyl(34) synthesis GTPase MnmE [Clostridiales bacterium]|jgi:tRNA modification GTPase|nr:tRNA uridine-5-carboxymethylaminomethyl(34) synthesis GTPase MnmE [Clostridiales bacterium]
MRKIIAAPSTPRGRGGIGIIRISGEGCLKIAARLFEPKNSALKSVERAVHAVMNFGVVEADGVIDRCYMVFFRAPDSFTGEDVVEFHCHGGETLLNAVLKKLYYLGVYPAEPGEFTKRAFLNGKIRLSDAEGIIDVINADSTAALRAACRLMNGELSKETCAMQDALAGIIAGIEAVLDYPDEVDGADAESAEALGGLIAHAEFLLKSAKRTEVVKRGVNVALIGAPNAGKSSLLNRLSGRDRAIVTEIAGTTRDTVEESFEYGGVRLNLVDTAGIRADSEADGVIEKKGIERSYAAAKGADIVLLVIDADEYESSGFLPDTDFLKEREVIVVFNKIDKISSISSFDENSSELRERFGEIEIFGVSALTGEGTERLLNVLAERFKSGDGGAETAVNMRQGAEIADAIAHLKAASEGFFDNAAECILIDLRAAWSALGRITGQTASEALIDEIFGKFCLGK